MDAVRADGISALRAGNARPYEFDHTSGGERRGNHWSPALPPLWGSWRAAPERDIHKPRRAAASLPFRGGKPLRRGRADEGIGPYKVQRKIEGCGRTESSAPTGCDARSEEWCACIGMAEDVGYEMKGAGLHVYR